MANGAYQKVTNDAKAIAGLLRAAGFDELALHENLGIREPRQAIKDFSNVARDTDTAVVYYSGHGIEVNGVNYLIPTDAILDSGIDVPYEAYSLDNLVQVLEPARRLRLVMLDACRKKSVCKEHEAHDRVTRGGGRLSVYGSLGGTEIALVPADEPQPQAGPLPTPLTRSEVAEAWDGCVKICPRARRADRVLWSGRSQSSRLA